ncbi:hypothetical protein DSB67_23040 [Vibrio campbellii]|nr:hypothetical protein DSB67_23040 [Vibrio campbellii]
MTANTNYGCGLVIVERICEHMSWPFELDDDGIRFTAKVDFYSKTLFTCFESQRTYSGFFSSNCK